MDRMDLLHELEEVAVKRGEFILASGQKSDIYLDMKHALLRSNTSRMIVDRLVELIGDHPVAGYGLGGSLLVGSVLPRLNTCGLIVRDTPKDHGTKAVIEGKADRNVMLLEDVITTGGSVRKAIRILEENGYKVELVGTVMNRGLVKQVDGVPVVSLLEHKV